MLRSFYSGISGLRNHQQAMDVVGNNLANVNTTGYKASRTTFMDTLSQTVQGGRAGSGTTGGKNAMQVGLGMTIAAIDRDVGQGALQSTGRNLDMAIEGEGWFRVGKLDAQTGDQSFYYTRAGNFFVDDAFNLVTSTGDFVYGWVDTDKDGSVDTTRDVAKFINLDRRLDGYVSNALASATPPISGPNRGDADIKQVNPIETTTSDTWRVECINAEQGWFRVSGAKTGVIGTYSYQNQVQEDRLGTFTIDMGSPARARLAVPFTAKDGQNEVFTLDNSGSTELTVNFLSGDIADPVQVSLQGTVVTVTMDVDADGLVSATYQDIADAINAKSDPLSPTYEAGFPLDVSSFTGTSTARATALVNQVVGVPVGVGTTFDVGDVGPVGVLSWTSNDYGAGGNNVNVQFINRGAQQRTTEVIVDGSKISVYLSCNSSGAVNATASDVYDAFQNSAEASALISMDDPAALGVGDLVVEPFNQLFFQGGSGANLGDYFTFTTTAAGGAKLQSLSVNREGGIIGVFDNGSTEEIARVAVAKIPNPQGLLSVGQGKFSTSPVSGDAVVSVAGTEGTGGIASGFLEMSNVDLTREFTDMIVNQRGFQANSRIITTSDEMLQELMALKR